MIECCIHGHSELFYTYSMLFQNKRNTYNHRHDQDCGQVVEKCLVVQGVGRLQDDSV